MVDAKTVQRFAYYIFRWNLVFRRAVGYSWCIHTVQDWTAGGNHHGMDRSCFWRSLLELRN